MIDNNLKSWPKELRELDDDAVVVLIHSRFHALCERGCDPEAAVVVAVHPEVGVEEASRLLRRGCDARTALRILL